MSFINPKFRNRKPIVCGFTDVLVPTQIIEENGFVTTEWKNLDEVVTNQQMESYPTDLKMCLDNGIPLNPVDTSGMLEPTDVFTQEQIIGNLVNNLDSETYMRVMGYETPVVSSNAPQSVSEENNNVQSENN